MQPTALSTQSQLRFVFVLWLAAFALQMRPAYAQESQANFFRGINLNGPAIVIDNQHWDAGDAAGFDYDAKAFDKQGQTLKPATDPSRAKMIRSSRWGQSFRVDVLNVPPGLYQVFAYVWEDNNSENYSISLNGKVVVKQHTSGPAGSWKRLGPWKTKVEDGVIRLSSSGGAANFSGVEIWSGAGKVPNPQVAQFASTPTPEQLDFFESKIRPLLIDHCYDCHSLDAGELGGQLLLDSRPGIVKGGLSGPAVIPGDPDNSLLIKALRHTDADLKMPPDDRLPDDKIADLAQWIRMRAPDPRTEDTAAIVKARTAIDWERARDFWSLKPLAETQPPTVKDSNWPSQPIDNFIASKLDTAGLVPASDADKQTLIRRATYDLIGLPPSPEEIENFVNDASSEAFAKVVDRLLQSPLYGQRWGRHWLDVVRYADTAGDNSDFPIPQVHLYRNWVIDAFNADMPYDQFVREQLAGDLIGGTTPEEKRSRIIATGYLANSRRFGSRVDDYPWHLTIEDTLDNLGRTFLATSINCARCHDHKFDPITTEDYYALYGFFHSTQYPWPGIELEQKQRDFVTLADPAEVKRVRQERDGVQKELDEAVKTAKKERKDAEDDAKKELDEKVKQAEVAARKHAAMALPYETLYAVSESETIEDVPVHLKGDPAKAGPIVARRFLQVLHGEPLPADDTTSGRLQLANWIVNRNNPLTARVMVNRIWLHHFGKALVTTPNDFGRHGHQPTHPKLLDWLAKHFIDTNWSIKAMHRSIMLSRTYRMSSGRSAVAEELDPANSLYSAYPRHRMDAESIRDTLLLLGGHLDTTPGAEHPFPPSSEWKFTQHNPFKATYDTNRRSVYLMTQRIQRHQYLAIFDGADPSASTPNRLVSTTPLQALYLLNDKFVHDQAAAIAAKALAMKESDEVRIQRVWRLMFGRQPDGDETSMAIEFLKESRQKIANSLGSDSNAEQALELESGSWQSLVRSLVRTNEFVYID
jgi:Protein of unknown function (DUF1553)/Protein of unknown function (DUF1549)/Planctomycete cytochrome C